MADLKHIVLSPHQIELLDKINELVNSKNNITSEIEILKVELEKLGSGVIVSATEPENPEEGLIWVDISEGVDFEKTYLKVSGGTMIGPLVAGSGVNLSRGNNSATGIKLISDSDPSQIYIADATNTGKDGMSGNLTAPKGLNVTTMATRQVMKPSEGSGWTWESLSDGETTPTIVAELSATSGNFRTVGTITGSVVYNANANDYAEFFPRRDKETTEVGDIIALATNEDEEVYKKATDEDKCIVGVHSECFGHIVGGEEPPLADINFFQYNIDNYIPVALAGRCPVKVVGKVKKGDAIVPSNIPGVGRAMYVTDKDISKIIGYLVEADDKVEVRLLKVKLK